MPLLRKIARQKYLEEREQKQLTMLRDTIDDEEYAPKCLILGAPNVPVFTSNSAEKELVEVGAC